MNKVYLYKCLDLLPSYNILFINRYTTFYLIVNSLMLYLFSYIQGLICLIMISIENQLIDRRLQKYFSVFYICAIIVWKIMKGGHIKWMVLNYLAFK